MTLAPSAWPADERARWLAQAMKLKPGNNTARGRTGIVTTAHHSLATRVGIEALKQGGSATDAILATALAQITLGSSAAISFFGLFGLAHYEASTREVTSLAAGWKTCLGETDPMSIDTGGASAFTTEQLLAGAVSGRSAMVGGFMKALELAHARFGKLPFARLFDAAIELAEEGFTIDEELGWYIAMRGDDLRRLPDTAAIFVRPDGQLYQTGDHFRQPALAASLRGIATNGADWMYKGDWAKRTAAAVQREGGAMTAEDIASYEVDWSTPLRTRRGEYEIAFTGGTCHGAIDAVEAMNIADAAGIRGKGHWSQSPESFRDMTLITNAALLASFPPQYLPDGLRQLDWSDAGRQTPEHAAAIWKAMRAPSYPLASRPAGKSDNAIAIDQWGNIAALCHTSNCMCWGKTALIVDGIAIHDPGVYQPTLMAAAGPGGYVRMPLEVGIMLKDGVGVTGFASKNMGLHQKTVQSLLNMTDFGMSAVDAANAPAFGVPIIDATNPAPRARVVEGDFDEALLDATGLDIERVSKANAWLPEGHWVPASRDPVTGALTATSPEHASGQAAGY